MKNFIKNNVIRPLTLTTGTSQDINVEDCQGIVFYAASFASANAANEVKLEHADAEGGSYTELTGSPVIVSHEDEMLVVEVHRPIKPWIRLDSGSGSAEDVDAGCYILYGIGKAPATNDVDEEIKSALLTSPADKV